MRKSQYAIFAYNIMFCEVMKMKLRLRDLREDKDLNQSDIAKYLKCTQQTYSRYELGQVQPSLEALIKLAKFYNTSIDYILFLTDNPTPYN